MTDKNLPRVFRYNSVDLDDPGPEHDAVDVRNLYAATYPEITSAAIEGPEQKDGKLVYTFRKAVGTKGAPRRRTAPALVRTTLEDIAAGRHASPGAAGVTPDTVKAGQGDFRPWADLVNASLNGGECLDGPTGLLPPLA